MKIFKLIAVSLILALSCMFIACTTSVEHTLNFAVDDDIYETKSIHDSEIIIIPDTPSKEGYDFDGWYWDNNVWEKPLTDNSFFDTSNANTVYAKWNRNIDFYIIAFSNWCSAGKSFSFYTIGNFLVYGNLSYNLGNIQMKYTNLYEDKNEVSSYVVSESVQLSFPLGEISNMVATVKYYECFEYKEMDIAGCNAELNVDFISLPCIYSSNIWSFSNLRTSSTSRSMVKMRCEDEFSNSINKLKEMIESSDIENWEKILLY